MSDGACALLLCSFSKINELHKLQIRENHHYFKIVSYADYEVEPVDFCIAPYFAAKIALKKAHLNLENIDFFEFNEAFAVTVLANIKV